MKKITYTTIIHQAREKLDLSVHEYCVLDIINKLSNNKDYPYCVLGRQNIAECIGLTRQAIINIIKTLEEKKLIERNPQNHLRATELWYDNVELDCKESLQGCKENIQESVKECDTNCKESLHNNNTITKDIIKEIVDPIGSTAKHFLDWYCTEYLKHIKDEKGNPVKYIVQGAKDITLLKKLLKVIKEPELQSLALKYLKSTDKWIQNTGHPIGIFYSQINKFRASGNTLLDRERRLHYTPKGRAINV